MPITIINSKRARCTVTPRCEYDGPTYDGTPTGDPDVLNELQRHQRDAHGIVFPSSRALAEARIFPAVVAAYNEATALHKQVAIVIERARQGKTVAGYIDADLSDEQLTRVLEAHRKEDELYTWPKYLCTAEPDEEA